MIDFGLGPQGRLDEVYGFMLKKGSRISITGRFNSEDYLECDRDGCLNNGTLDLNSKYPLNCEVIRDVQIYENGDFDYTAIKPLNLKETIKKNTDYFAQMMAKHRAEKHSSKAQKQKEIDALKTSINYNESQAKLRLESAKKLKERLKTLEKTTKKVKNDKS